MSAYVPNPKCPWVTVEPAGNPNVPRWEVQSVGYRDSKSDPPADGSANIYVKVVDARGNPLGGVWVWQSWPDGTADKSTDRNGKVDFFMSGDSSFDPAKGRVGPYSVYLRHLDYPTATVKGMGLPLKQHVNYDLVFRLEAGAPTPPPAQTLEEAARAAVTSVPWMPVNNGAALWNFAKAKGLQDQQTDELTFMFAGEEYVAQVFNLGIVYAKKGDWGNIQVIAK